MAKYKLDLQPDPEVVVIGISSHVKDHRLCWSINRAMGLELARRRKDINEDNQGRVARFAVYDHVEGSGPSRYTLLNNHSGEGFLLKEHRQADFFLVVDNELAEQHPDLVDRVRAADFVLTAFPLPYAQLREGYKLLL